MRHIFQMHDCCPCGCQTCLASPPQQFKLCHGRDVLRRVLHLEELNQQTMLDIRNAWFEETGGAPNGNRCEVQLQPGCHACKTLVM